VGANRADMFGVESYEKRVHPYLFHSRKRVQAYQFRFRKIVQAYLFRPKKECRPICSTLENDAGQPGPHLYDINIG